MEKWPKATSEVQVPGRPGRPSPEVEPDRERAADRLPAPADQRHRPNQRLAVQLAENGSEQLVGQPLERDPARGGVHGVGGVHSGAGAVVVGQGVGWEPATRPASVEASGAVGNEGVAQDAEDHPMPGRWIRAGRVDNDPNDGIVRGGGDCPVVHIVGGADVGPSVVNGVLGGNVVLHRNDTWGW